jgi:hypothetical protein
MLELIAKREVKRCHDVQTQVLISLLLQFCAIDSVVLSDQIGKIERVFRK